MVITKYEYSRGYDDALFDIKLWFNNHSHIFRGQPKAGRLLKVILDRIWAERNKFFTQKAEYEITFTEKEVNIVCQTKKNKISV